MVSDHDFGEAMNAWATMHEEHVAQIAALKAERDRMREAMSDAVRELSVAFERLCDNRDIIIERACDNVDIALCTLRAALAADATKDGAK